MIPPVLKTVSVHLITRPYSSHAYLGTQCLNFTASSLKILNFVDPYNHTCSQKKFQLLCYLSRQQKVCNKLQLCRSVVSFCGVFHSYSVFFL